MAKGIYMVLVLATCAFVGWFFGVVVWFWLTVFFEVPSGWGDNCSFVGAVTVVFIGILGGFHEAPHIDR